MCALTRARRGDLPAVTIKDVYQHPTVRALAAAVAGREVTASAAAPAPVPAYDPTRRPRRRQHLVCGAAQAFLFVLLTWIIGAVFLVGGDWIIGASGFVPTYERMAAFGAAVLLATVVLPVIAKWVLIGRWRPRRFPVWGMTYLRFWVVKTLIRSCPLAHLPGSPLLTMFLRALGARVGPGAVVLTNHFPVCTDMVDIGAGAVVRKDSFLNGYRITDGIVEIGPVRIGRDAVVGEMTVMEVDSSLGDSAELAHASALQAGQSVPAGQRWLGSPAEPGAHPPTRPAPAECGQMRRFSFGLVQLVTDVLVFGPALLVALGWLLPDWDEVAPQQLLDGRFYAQQIARESALFWGVLAAGLVAVVGLSRLLSSVLPPDRVFPLYGWRWSAQRLVARLSNLATYLFLFGDSSAIVHWLRALGWDLSQVVQTGSNFGTAVRQEAPGLSAVGTGTMVSDGLSMLNADFSGTSFRLRRTAVAPRNFVGNDIPFPPDARIGENCLLATRVHVPVDGPVRRDVGLLGSPPFEIPRSVERDRAVDRYADPVVRRAALRGKNRHNVVTAALYLLVRWGYFVLVTLVLGIGTVAADGFAGTFAFGGALLAVSVLGTVYFILVERTFRRLRPRFCPIYERDFWRHERYWKIPGILYIRMYNGTPFKALLWRALGVRIGRRVVDDGCWIVERTLAAIGDDCTLNEGSEIQSHSLEDGMFKSDHIEIGSGCTIGTRGFVHYGAQMGDGSRLEADAFLMKGQRVGPGERWGGNPAQVLDDPYPGIAAATMVAARRQ